MPKIALKNLLIQGQRHFDTLKLTLTSQTYLNDLKQFFKSNGDIKLTIKTLHIDFPNEMSYTKRAQLLSFLSATFLEHVQGLKVLSLTSRVDNFGLQSLFINKALKNIETLNFVYLKQTSNQVLYPREVGRRGQVHLAPPPIKHTGFLEMHLVNFLNAHPNLKSLIINSRTDGLYAAECPKLKEAIMSHPGLINFYGKYRASEKTKQGILLQEDAELKSALTANIPAELIRAKQHLERYVKTGAVERFFNGQWNSHHIIEATVLIKRIGSADANGIHDINSLLEELDDIEIVNPKGALAKCILLISQTKNEVYDSTEKPASPGLSS